MIIAVLSDLHSNLLAFNAVLDDAQHQGAEEFWCLGDVVGYCPWPLQVWQGLHRLNIPPWGWVAGNHDWGLVGRLDEGNYIILDKQKFQMGFFRPEASWVIALHKDALQNQAPLLEHLASLPVVTSPRAGVYLVHGRFIYNDNDSTGCVIYYVRNQGEAEACWQTLHDHPLPWDENAVRQRVSPEGWQSPRLMIVGHTHEPVLWQRDSRLPSNGRRWTRLSLPIDGWLSLEGLEDRPVLMNPGSVGQPRDGSTLARYALLKWRSPEPPQLLIRQIQYRYDQVQSEMRNQGYPEQLIDMLGPKRAH